MKKYVHLLLAALACLTLAACQTKNMAGEDGAQSTPSTETTNVPQTGQVGNPSVDKKLIPATSEWADQIRAKVLSHLKMPSGVKGRPRAEFLVHLKPDGKITHIRLVQSSGNKKVDNAINRAIAKSSPLPLPLEAEAFQSELRLVFDPLAK